MRLDSITRDTRCPEGYQCFVPGGAEAKFTIGYMDSLITFKVSTDSMVYRSLLFLFRDFTINNSFIFNLLSIRPQRQGDAVIPQLDYEADFVLESGPMVEKPNIYLYPTRKTKLDVSLGFPQGGEVIKSIPDFPNEWKNIKVKPSGSIDNEYDYLFYEAALPDRWQVDEGWSIQQKDLELFFRQNMNEYGFNETEINDFIDYWIPKLKNSPFYNIYPQYTEKVDELVILNISKVPDSIMRLFYVIKEAPEKEDLPVPMIPEFDAKGFTVREWGVILK